MSKYRFLLFPSEFCFHQENIKAAVEQAIRAKNGQNAKGL
jgi:hypothetical protein